MCDVIYQFSRKYFSYLTDKCYAEPFYLYGEGNYDLISAISNVHNLGKEIKECQIFELLENSSNFKKYICSKAGNIGNI